MPLPLTCQSNTSNVWTESHQASPWGSTGPGRDLPLLYAFADDTHLPDNKIINIIFFSSLVVTSLFPQICAESPEIPACQFGICILTLQHEQWKSFAQKTALFCMGFQAQQHHWGFLASVLRTVRQGEILFHQERSCGDSKECVMWQLQPRATVPGMQRLTARQQVKSLLLWMDSHKFQLGCLCEAGIHQPLARTLAPLATGHRDICSWLCFPYTSLWESPAHPLDGHHNVLSHERFCFFFSLPC